MKRGALRAGLWIWLLPALLPLLARADVLVGTNGERFVGTVIEETSTNVVFESELAGRLVFPQSKIRDLLRAPLSEETNMPVASVIVTNAPTNSVSWKPPGVGHDGSDWVQLKSGEWLRGQLKYVQNKEVEFDSDEMELQTLKLKDVRKLYPAHRMFTQFMNQQPVYGKVVISNELVTVNGAEPLSLHRDLLMGITPSGGTSGINNWSGDVSVGLSLQSGNNDQTTISTTAELARRTPNTTLLFNYLLNYSQVNNVQSANNDRLNSSYDVRLNQDWFLRPVQLEYFHDSLANISYRLTGGTSAGYYIFDRNALEWTVSAGPGYQYTRFSTVQADETDSASTPAGVLTSDFKDDITDRLTFKQSWQSIITSREAGQYTHHSVTTLEFEIKKHLNLDVSFIWDFLENPQTRSDGTVPLKSDYYLTVGFGARF
jgi:hypothetical protein